MLGPADECELNGWRRRPGAQAVVKRAFMFGLDHALQGGGAARRSRRRPQFEPGRALKNNSTKRGRHAASRRGACIGMALQFLAATPALCENPEYTIVIKGHRFVPAQLSIPARTKVRIVLDNQGTTEEEFDSHALNREKHVAPGSQAIVFVGPLEPGRYIFQGDESDDPGGPALGIIEAR
ncbi:MAG: cupredoxin domain-containing protein [Burkholderiales bacterium]|nr:cupredoxin domain-containing protein [Burkholderiales bacterium]MDE2457309.1 cupredoxin domain-containing protein [Burkholderiales bacterium]